MSNIYIDNISSYLDYYIKIPNPQYAVMINGKWGSGKTYFIKELKEKWDESVKSEKDKIYMRPLYISLNGLSATSQVSQKIRAELHPILYSKGVKFAKKVILGTITALSKCSFDINGDGNNDDLSDILDANSLFNILTKPNDKITGNKIVIFDDLERCKISIDEIFGYINDLVEHSKCHVILLCNEEYLENNPAIKKAEYIKYSDFKEKLIGQTLLFKQDYKNIVKTFIPGIESDIIKEHSELVIDLFITSKIENLRIIKQCISDASRFIGYINKDSYNIDNYKKYVKCLLAYFVIAYCEYKSGNQSISYFQTFESVSYDEKKNSDIRKITDKYQNVLNKYEIHHSSKIIQIDNIVQYIKSGFLEDEDKIFNSSEILNPRNVSNWEKLYFYFQLDDDEFESILEVVKNQFFNEKLNCVSIVIHIYALFLHFIKMKVITDIKPEDLKAKAIEHMDYIFEQTEEVNSYDKLIVQVQGSALGKKYYDYESEEIQTMVKYAETRRMDYYSRMSSKYCNLFWHNLNNENFDEIYTYFEKETPNGYSKYSLNSIFEHVDPSIVADNIIKLSNVNKEKLYYIIYTRYNDRSAILYFCKDLEPLLKIKDCLTEKLLSMKFIARELTQNIINIITSSCEQLEKLK